MKKIIALILLIICCLSLSSCQLLRGEAGKNGEDGDDGKTPYIGDNGNWWIDDEDLGVSAQGPAGAKGESGTVIYDGTEGLDFYPLPDGTYGVKVGRAVYLEEIVIPDKYNGKNVTAVLDGAFEECSNLKAVTIPDSITAIGEGAFFGCTALASVTIPDSVTSIGTSAFCYCGLTSITIPDGVTSIGYRAFYGCGRLTNVTIPDSVTIIDDAAFYGCISLESVNIPNSVTIIGDNAFADCDAFTNIVIPSSVNYIGTYAFNGCDSLTSVIFENADGWKCTEPDSQRSALISSTYLSDYTRAAKYLTETYREYFWQHS